MAGWTKKKRMGCNVSKLFEDKEAYGKGLHDKLFNEACEDVKKKDDDEIEECGDVDRISQLLNPDAGGDMDDYEGPEGEEEGGEEEDEITIKIEKEEDEAEDEVEDEEELEEGAADLIKKVATVLQDLFQTDEAKALALAKMMDQKAAADFVAKFSGSPVKGSGGPFGSMSKQEDTNEEDGAEESLEEAAPIADLKMVDQVLGALGETPLQGLSDLLTIAGQALKGGSEKAKVANLLKKIAAWEKANGIEEEKEDDEEIEESCDDKDKEEVKEEKDDKKDDELEESSDEEDEELDEAMGGTLGGALERIRTALDAPASAVGKKKAKSEFKKVVGKTGIGTPAADKLAVAGDDEDDELEDDK